LIYRLIYTLWKFFWTSVGVLLATAVVIAGLTLSALQLPVSKDYIKGQLTDSFNKNFEGELKVESVSGFLPFRAELNEVEFYSPGNNDIPELELSSLALSVNLWELARKNIQVLTFDLNEPVVRLSSKDDTLTLASIFKQTDPEAEPRAISDEEPFFKQFHFYAPLITINNGKLHADESIELPTAAGLKSPLTIEDINTSLLFENEINQFFIDLNDFSAFIPDSEHETVNIRGQFFNDGRYLELNGFEFESAMANVQFNGEATPVDIFSENFREQASIANYRIDLQRAVLPSKTIKSFVPDSDFPPYDLELRSLLNGTLDSLWLDRFELYYGDSSILAEGLLKNVTDSNFEYDIQLENLVLNQQELNWLAEHNQFDFNLSGLDNSLIRGNISGGLNKTLANLDLQTAVGDLYFDGEIGYLDKPEYEFLLQADSLNITPFLKDTTRQSLFSGLLTARGKGFDRDADVSASIHLRDGKIYDHAFTRAVAEINYLASKVDYNGWIDLEDSEIASSGNFVIDDNQLNLVSDGSVSNLHITEYLSDLPFQNATLTGRYSLNMQGRTIDDIFGRLSVEMTEAMIDGEELRPHQLYFDIDSPENDTRTLRFTSSFFDAELSGSIKPSLIADLGVHWLTYFRDRISDEIIFDDELLAGLFESEIEDLDPDLSLDLNTQIRIRDLELLRHYLPEMPKLKSNAQISASATATNRSLSISSTISDNEFLYEDNEIKGLNSTLSGTFNYTETLRKDSRLDFQVNGNSISIGERYNFAEAYVNMSMRNDSISVQHNFGIEGDELTYRSTFEAVLFSDKVEVIVDELLIGTTAYEWKNIGEPKITLHDDRSATLREFVMTSGDDHVEINGTFSSSYEDSVDYKIRDFNLGRISELIGGRVQFSGIVNGDFVTRSLTDTPSIQGDLYVDDGRLNGRIIGDVKLKSVFNSETDRFDTNIHVYTDPEKYSDYLENNDGIGQDLRLEGYFKIPDDLEEDEDFFYFDADLREIDMWIVTAIVPNIVIDMHGNSSGSGYISGSRSDFDFSATFDIEDVYGEPVFMNVGYTLNGELVFNRTDGLLFNDIELTDGNGGNGVLYGQIDLDNFSPTTILDLNLDLDNLHFMNNPQDREVPFFASLYGTGSAQITGTNFDPFIRTTQTVSLSSNSRVSIPLREEIEFEQDRRFIQFVDSFDEVSDRLIDLEDENGISNDNDTDPDQLTFLELFTLDLQITADNPINVSLIFDPVTNEILNSTGTGQLRILLQDQDVNMFGRYDIQDGEYQFVAGDIFTRRFSLQEGGNISWQGDLENASLNVTASYRARPDISTLLPAITTFQRVPIELILQIGGTISEVENEFYFNIPTGIEGTVDPTIASQINTLNQNEDEKVLQAFSILLTGNFLPSEQAQTFGIGENVTGTTALVNPLISSQIISPLLSNQINSLLNSDIVFDVDVNLTRNRVAGEEGDQFGVDLDVALRLFDDRVILRREGQVAGQQSNIGDLGATYRINRIFSVTAFHRQDPTLAARTETDSRQTQEMNGVGLEAQFQFNTWQSLRNRVSNSFRKLFGKKEKDTEQEETETLAGN